MATDPSGKEDITPPGRPVEQHELVSQLLEALKIAKGLLSQVDPGDPALDGWIAETDAAVIDGVIEAAATAPVLMEVDEALGMANDHLDEVHSIGYDKGCKEPANGAYISGYKKGQEDAAEDAAEDAEEAWEAGWELGRKKAGEEDAFDAFCKTQVPLLGVLEAKKAYCKFKAEKEDRNV